MIETFIFPTISFIKELITVIYIIVISKISINRINKNNKKITFELVAFLIFVIGISIILNFIFKMLISFNINSLEESFSMKYIKLINYLNYYSIYISIPSILFWVALVVVMVIKKLIQINTLYLKQKRNLNGVMQYYLAVLVVF